MHQTEHVGKALQFGRLMDRKLLNGCLSAVDVRCVPCPAIWEDGCSVNFKVHLGRGPPGPFEFLLQYVPGVTEEHRMFISVTADIRTKPCTNTGQEVYQLRQLRALSDVTSISSGLWHCTLQVKHSGRGLLYRIKIKVVPLNAIKACGGARVHLSLRTRWRRVVSFTPRPLYSPIHIEPEGRWVPETVWNFGISAPAGNRTKTSLLYRP